MLAYGKPRGEPVKGKLIPPVQGKVISLFKEKGQNGIEIKAPAGTEIRAVLPGRVLYADWFKGFGNIVIIDHGDHIFTVSGYSSQLLKKEGDTVAQGEPIALVGSAGSLKGPCLYFEIRRNGNLRIPCSGSPIWIRLSPSRRAARRKRKEGNVKEDHMSHWKGKRILKIGLIVSMVFLLGITIGLGQSQKVPPASTQYL